MTADLLSLRFIGCKAQVSALARLLPEFMDIRARYSDPPDTVVNTV